MDTKICMEENSQDALWEKETVGELPYGHIQ